MEPHTAQYPRDLRGGEGWRPPAVAQRPVAGPPAHPPSGPTGTQDSNPRASPVDRGTPGRARVGPHGPIERADLATWPTPTLRARSTPSRLGGPQSQHDLGPPPVGPGTASLRATDKAVMVPTPGNAWLSPGWRTVCSGPAELGTRTHPSSSRRVLPNVTTNEPTDLEVACVSVKVSPVVGVDTTTGVTVGVPGGEEGWCNRPPPQWPRARSLASRSR